MDLGTLRPDYGSPKLATASPEKSTTKMKKVYPTITLEKDTGNKYAYGDEFTAVVRFRVKKVEHGEQWEGEKPKHICILEALSMDAVKSSKKGLPY